MYHKPLAICSFNKVTLKILLAKSLSYLYFKVATQISWCIWVILGALLYQMSKSSLWPYESLAWASKSNITGRNCFRMYSFILNLFLFFIQFSINTQKSITNIANVKCTRYDICISRTMIRTEVASLGITCTNVKQQQQKQNTNWPLSYSSFLWPSTIPVPSPYNTSIHLLIYYSLYVTMFIEDAGYRLKECAVKSPLSSYRSY